MINLDTAEKKKEFLSEYRGRRVTVWLWSISAILAISLVLAVLIAYLVALDTSIAKEYLSSTKTSIAQKGFSELVGLVNKTNTQLALSPVNNKNEIVLADILEEILRLKPAGVKFSTIEINKIEAVAKVSLRGNFSTRKSFNIFIESLSVEPGVSELVSPIANLLKTEKGDFTVSFNLSKAKVIKNND